MFTRFTILLGMLVLVLLPAQAQTTSTSQGAFQPFEGGYMLWRGDTGDIWVLYDNGTLNYFAETTYAGLPDNPVVESPPSNLVKPIRGFGRVWGNFPGVRQTLGWGLRGEEGYTMRWENIALIGNGAITFRVNFPTGEQVEIRDNDTWRFYVPIPTPAPTDPPPVQGVRGTYQSYQSGFMMWFGETGDIWVFFNSGELTRFPINTYGALPENPVTTAPPFTLTRPIMGFGKVWGHFPRVRARLGWATAGERALSINRQPLAAAQTTTSANTGAFTINNPFGDVIVINDDDTWTYR